MKKYYQKGFTVLELIIAIVIMSVLTAMTVKVMSSMRATNRDNKRALDVKEMQSSLEMYYKDFGYYPTTLVSGQSLASGQAVYMSKIPSNPKPSNDGKCPGNVEYVYTQDAGGASYHISFCLGSRVGDIGSGNNYVVPGDILSCIPDCYLSCAFGTGNNGADGCGGICSNALSSCPAGFTCTSNHCVKD